MLSFRRGNLKSINSTWLQSLIVWSHWSSMLSLTCGSVKFKVTQFLDARWEDWRELYKERVTNVNKSETNVMWENRWCGGSGSPCGAQSKPNAFPIHATCYALRAEKAWIHLNKTHWVRVNATTITGLLHIAVATSFVVPVPISEQSAEGCALEALKVFFSR